MGDLTWLTVPILSLRLLQLHALAPARAIADLCTLRSTKSFAQDHLHGLAHLRLEPQCDSSGILLRAFQDYLVVHREQKMGAGAGILCQLLQGEVEDVSGSGLNRSIEPFGVFGLVILIGGDHTTPPQGAPGLPFVLCPVGLLPPIELGERSTECFAILVSLRCPETLPSVLVDVLAVLLGAKAVEETQSCPLSSLTRGVVLTYRFAHQLGSGLQVDVLPLGEGIEHVYVPRVVGGYAKLLLGKVTLNYRATIRSPHAPTKLVGLLLVDTLCVRVTVENSASHSGGDLRLRVHPSFLVEVWYPPRVSAQGVRLLAVEVEGVDELVVLTMIEEGLILQIREFDPYET